jgi:oxaloacetate decarboxylase alpha subunit
VPGLVDTTIRLLGQEPLAGRVPTADVYRLAEILDGAGFAALEVTGGGCFDSAVKRGVESPWERIRALKARVSTPLAMGLRGRFLVGSRPSDTDTIRRFVATAAENGIDVFRIHDPLNDVEGLREPGEAILAAGRTFDAGLVYSAGRTGEAETLLEQARRLPDIGASRILLHDPTGSLQPHRASDLVQRLAEASGLPVGVYFQGVGGNALATSIEAARAGADLISCSAYPVALTLHRAPAEELAPTLEGLGISSGVDIDVLWQAADLIDEHIGDELIAPLAPRIAVRAAEYGFPAGLVAALDAHLRTYGAADRLDDVLDELARVRTETGWLPLASPVSQILASQALINVLSASRYQTVVDELREILAGRYGHTPGEADATVKRAVELVTAGHSLPEEDPPLEELREEAAGLATSEEELLLLALFKESAEPLLRTIRSRMEPRGERVDDVDLPRAERIREIVSLVQESGVGEITIEDGDMRVTVRRTDSAAPQPSAAPLATQEPAPLPEVRPTGDTIRVEAPMVGTFYRSASPGAQPFVEVGDPVVPGQTLCILEAMKLMNEVKSDHGGIVRAIHKENADPVQFGDVLFELEPLNGRPLDAY